VGSVWIRARDLSWGMDGHPDFQISQHSDETRKVGYTLELEPTFEGLRPNRWLLYKGTLLPTIGRLAYEVARHPPLSDLFRMTYRTPLESTKGRYLFLRSISALAALVLILATHRLARRLSGSAWAGVLGALLVATSFGLAYTGVTFKSDALMAAVLAVLFVASVGYVRLPTAARAVAMGLALGVAGATKHTAVFGAIVPIIATLVAPSLRWSKRALHLGLAAAAALIALAVCAPYYLLEPAELVEALKVTLHYQSDRLPAFEGLGFQPAAVVTHLLSAGLGPIGTGLGLVGVAYAAVRAWRHAERAYLPLLAFVALYFAVLSRNAWLVLRYTIPLYPLLCGFAGIAIWRAMTVLSRRSTRRERAVVLALAALLAAQLLWFLAFERLLSEPTPPARAAAWLRDNLPEGARVLEMRDRRPVVYGYSSRRPDALTGLQLSSVVDDVRRLRALPYSSVVPTAVVITTEQEHAAKGAHQ